MKGFATDSKDKPNTSIDYDRIEELADALVNSSNAIPDVVHQQEQFKSMVFDMANKLAIAGHGDEAVSMHRIHNRL